MVFIRPPHEAGLKLGLRGIKMSAVTQRVEMNAISFVLQFRLIAGADGELGIDLCALP
jgi:hypothetical protein